MLGACPNCGFELIVDDNASLVICRCGTRFDASQLRPPEDGKKRP